MSKKEAITFDNLADAMQFLKKTKETAEKAVADYRHQVRELTGYAPNDSIGPYDVAMIIKNVLKL